MPPTLIVRLDRPKLFGAPKLGIRSGSATIRLITTFAYMLVSTRRHCGGNNIVNDTLLYEGSKLG